MFIIVPRNKIILQQGKLLNKQFVSDRGAEDEIMYKLIGHSSLVESVWSFENKKVAHLAGASSWAP